MLPRLLTGSTVTGSSGASWGQRFQHQGAASCPCCLVASKHTQCCSLCRGRSPPGRRVTTDCHKQCCGSGSGIRCLFDPWIRDPEWIFSGSRIPRPYFEELFDNFFGKKFYNSLKIGPNFFLQNFKTKIICNFVKFVAKTNFFTPLSFVAIFGSGIRDG